MLLRPGTASRSRGFFVRIGGHSSTVENEYRWTGSAYTQSGSRSLSENKSGAQFGLGYDWSLGSGSLRLSGTHYANFPGLDGEDALTLVKVGYLFEF
ncbi:hypothetical protein ACQV5M_19970 [Leptospira sp. SA-E8]|uniref:hypothetical protein n=1 Tax=Leptospira sp. SA-E8 TaxID=3422259 RepID=UPI003EC135DC